MKITVNQLRRVIKEEVQKNVREARAREVESFKQNIRDLISMCYEKVEDEDSGYVDEELVVDSEAIGDAVRMCDSEDNQKVVKAVIQGIGAGDVPPNDPWLVDFKKLLLKILIKGRAAGLDNIEIGNQLEYASTMR